MRNKKTPVLLVVILIIALSSCYSYYCSPAPGLRISTIGFTPSEINKIVLLKYAKGSGFTNLVDTLLIDSSVAVFTNAADTLNMSSVRSDALLQSAYDYVVYFPSNNITAQIAGIEEPQNKEKRGLFSAKNACVNIITSYQINGTTVRINGTDDRLFIHR
ncbi:MAG: hypothetical protein QM726_18580 [Chitinophagaceae bacterium]